MSIELVISIRMEEGWPTVSREHIQHDLQGMAIPFIWILFSLICHYEKIFELHMNGVKKENRIAHNS